MATHPTNSQSKVQPSTSSDHTQEEMTKKQWLLSLDQIEGADLPLVGGKAFRLATLKQHGFNVPSGLVLTAHFFEAQLQYSRLTPLWAGSPDVAVTTEALNWLADALKTKPLAKELAEMLNRQLDLVFGPDVDSFAVRSSAIDEDQRDHTFAGIHLTELGVPRSTIPVALSRCWASALTGPAIEYRQRHGMSIQGIRIAVLIQPMLSPISSGVGFTVNPMTGARDELIMEATWGLGIALVAGEIQPYFYQLAAQPPTYPLMEQRAGNVSPPPDVIDEAGQEPLSPEGIAELAHQLEQIQALMGEPQDVEWAWQDGVFFLLQTRPIAAIPQPEQLLDQAWTRGGYAEWLPEIPSPLSGSLLERSQHQASLFFKEIGLTVDGLGSYEKLILGRPYLNLSFLRRVIAQVGLHPDSFLQTIGYTKPVAIAGLFSVDWGAAWKTRRVYWMALKRVLSIRQQLKELQVLVDDVTNVLADTNLEAPSATLLGQLRQHDRLYSEFFAANLKLTVSIALIVGIGGRLIAPLAKAPTAVINALALKGLKTSQDELNQDLLTLSRLARDDQQTQEYLLAAPDDFQGYVQDSTIPAEFKRSFEAFLTRYGRRAAYEADVGWPRYHDNPTDLLRIVKQYVKNEPPPSNGGAAITWQTLTTPPRGIDRLFPWRRWLAKPFIGTLRRLFLMRDELTSTMARALAACRRWDLALAREWVDRGWLEQVDDIFWLTMQEIERTLMVGGGVAITLSSTVRARKDTYQTYANTEMPFNLRESQIPSIQLGIGLSSETPPDVTVGLPVSPGQARGTVVVVHHPDEVTELGDDAILVMPSTDPAWLALLHRASGLVVETGGLLSHGSVIAREYGLPAVANIPEATKRFHTGDKVLVDGSTGVVQILELGGISK